MLKMYSVSLAAGVLAGAIYALLGVNSPAPPIIALAGLLGMQIGEHVLPLIKRVKNGEPVSLLWFRHAYHHRIDHNPGSSDDKSP